jgi:hypothetical protein
MALVRGLGMEYVLNLCQLLLRRGLNMSGGRSSALAWWSAVTILVSAFLLFQVQPIISKKILPWFGGSPAVWTTCVLFFQLVLLAGYAYAHLLIKHVPTRRQGLVHAVLLALALMTLPIVPRDWWKPVDGNHPAMRILILLLLVVGPTYFLLSTTGPLVQAWFAKLYPGRSPYRLYALSNVGSLAALLSYPFWFETRLLVDRQGQLWSYSFVAFAGLVGILALTMWRQEPAEQPAGASPSPAPAQPAVEIPPTGMLRIGWLALATLASMALLAITNHLCQDIAVVPFMWVIPLSLYLLSFIICFDSERWYVRKLFGLGTVLTIGWLTAMQEYSAVDDGLEYPQRAVALFVSKKTFDDPEAAEEYAKKSLFQKITAAEPFVHEPFSKPMNKILDGLGWLVKKLDDLIQPRLNPNWQLRLNVDVYDFKDHVFAISSSYMLVLFLICMVCHGELVKFRPQPKYLTSFYLSISAGGALGGLFVALICPLVFKLHHELAQVMIGGFIVGCIALGNDGRQSWLKGREFLQWTAAFLIVGGVFLIAKGNVEGVPEKAVAVERNFYGTVTVTRMGEDEEEGRALYNGRIWHGFQYLDPARQLEPTTYYVEGTGAALAVKQHPRARRGLRVAVIGLGTGSMAAHAQAGDFYRFYDIDPKVVMVARKHFTYLEKSPGRPEVVLGDARISMERELAAEGSQKYDAIVLDAFSGDAIPAHLLTDESFALYEQHLRHDDSGNPTGVLAIHISNRYIDLEPVVAALAKKYGYQTINVHKDEDGGAFDTGSDWVLVSKNEEFLNNPVVNSAGAPLDSNRTLLWTDQFTALFPILK